MTDIARDIIRQDLSLVNCLLTGDFENAIETIKDINDAGDWNKERVERLNILMELNAKRNFERGRIVFNFLLDNEDINAKNTINVLTRLANNCLHKYSATPFSKEAGSNDTIVLDLPDKYKSAEVQT
jgi:hypothetical protein